MALGGGFLRDRLEERCRPKVAKFEGKRMQSMRELWPFFYSFVFLLFLLSLCVYVCMVSS